MLHRQQPQRLQPPPQQSAPRGHLLADLTGDVRLQAACEDLVDDTVAVVGIAGFLPIVVACGETTAVML